MTDEVITPEQEQVQKVATQAAQQAAQQLQQQAAAKQVADKMRGEIKSMMPINPFTLNLNGELVGTYGIGLRDYFASQALIGIMMNWGDKVSLAPESLSIICETAMKTGDHMFELATKDAEAEE